MKFAPFAWIAATCMSCTPVNNYEVSEMKVRKVEIASTGRPHLEMELMVEGELPNDCWEVDSIKVQPDEKNRVVTITASRKKLKTSPNRICSPAFSYPKISSRFTPIGEGTYVFQDSNGRVLAQTDIGG